MPIELLPPPTLVGPIPAQGPHGVALGILDAWNRGVSAGTIVARRSDLGSFGEHAWRLRSPAAIVRRVCETIASDRAALRELALGWVDALADRGIATASRARRWGSLASLAAACGGEIGLMPRTIARELEPRQIATLVARAYAAGDYVAAALVGLLGERGESEAALASLRVHVAQRLPCSAATKNAIAAACHERPAGAYAFGGRRRGTPLSPRGVRMAVERWGTTAAELRRAAALQSGGRP